MNWKRTANYHHPEDETRYTLSAPKREARGHVSSNAIEIEAHYHYNGSGPKAFGGAKQWPVVDLKVAFQEHEVQERDAFIEALQDFCANYFDNEPAA